MKRRFFYSISTLLFLPLVFGCYCGIDTYEESAWSDVEPSEAEGGLKVRVATPGGGDSADQGDALSISIEPDTPSDPVTIILMNNENAELILAEDFSGPYPFLWQIPSNTPPGESYRILITKESNYEDYYKDDESASCAISSEFAILEHATTGLSDITVSSGNISVTLTDNGSLIDGDTISVTLNENIISEHLILQGSPGTTISIELEKGINNLSITAVNEGSVSPNTAEIAFTDVVIGEAVQQWRLLEGETGSLRISAP